MNDLLERAMEFYKKEGLIPTAKLATFFGLNFAYHRRSGMWNYNREGIDIHNQDWDNLIILDACRSDIFWEQFDKSGEGDSKVSRGSATSEFIRANFTDRDLRDTVYITGNGWYLRLEDELNTEMYSLYDIGDNSDGKKIERTVDCTKEAIERHPNKRLLIHFIPPHHPFVGPLADDLLPSYADQMERPLFDRIRRGEVDISDNDLKEVYRENLDRVLPSVDELLEALPGKTVVTSDHGELLGERTSPVPIKYYGHIPGLYVDELVKVPWFTQTNGERKEIISEEPIESPIKEFSTEQQTIDERLRNLGYKL
jgi:hypothetical protein